MQNILDFEKDYKEAKVVLLEENYRSTKTILQAANDVIKTIATAVRRISGHKMKTGKKLSITGLMMSRMKLSLLLKRLKSLVAKLATNTVDFAVLYRTNAQSRTIEEALLKSNIPYTMVGAPSSTAERKFGMSLLIWTWLPTPVTISVLSALSMNPSGESGQVQWIRFATLPKCKSPHSWMLRQISCLRHQRKGSPGYLGLCQSHSWFERKIGPADHYRIGRRSPDKTGYMTALTNQGNLESQARIENIQEFLSVTKNFDENGETVEDETGVETLSRFWTIWLWLPIQMMGRKRPQKWPWWLFMQPKVWNSQWSSWLGWKKTSFPLSRAAEDPDELEEERRLAYVGITRAEKALFLTNANSRLLFGGPATTARRALSMKLAQIC